MSNKNKKIKGIVYSTDPDFTYDTHGEEQEETLRPSEQKLRVMLERKGRAGKDVTLIHGFTGSDSDKEELIKKLKTYCGTGGSFKDGEMIIQGDQRDKVLKFLLDKGFKLAKRGN